MTSTLTTKSILASACELIAERLDDSNEDPVEFLEQYESAISGAKDLEQVWPRLVLWVLIDSEFGIAQYAKAHSAGYAGIALVVSLYRRYLEKDSVSVQDWRDAFNACQIKSLNGFSIDDQITPKVLIAAAAAVGVMLPLCDEIQQYLDSSSLVEEVLFCQSQCLALIGMNLSKAALAQKDKFLALVSSENE